LVSDAFLVDSKNPARTVLGEPIRRPLNRPAGEQVIAIPSLIDIFIKSSGSRALIHGYIAATFVATGLSMREADEKSAALFSEHTIEVGTESQPRIHSTRLAGANAR